MEEVSLNFFRNVCDIIGTEEKVIHRRQMFASLDNICADLQGAYMISSGSRAEGLELHSSDLDLMMLYCQFQVYEQQSDVKIDFQEKWPLLVDSENSKTGYTKIKIPDDLHDRMFKAKFYDFEFESLISEDGCFPAQAFLHHIINTDMTGLSTLHGPCMSILEVLDVAPCLHSNNWISIARPWLARTKYSWANDSVIASIIEFGTIFVPIGSKNSPSTHYEWRISFSFAEKLLVWSFNHVQLLCYALLKILLKEVVHIHVKESDRNLLCSYHLKTVMFWLCEEIEISKWKPETLISSFMVCFKRLIYCVENSSCPHYFIPEINLFQDRFDREQHKSILSTLNELWHRGWTCLLQTQTLSSSKIVLGLSFSDFVKEPLLPDLFFSLHFYQGSDLKVHLKQCVYCCVRSKQRYWYVHLLSNVMKKCIVAISHGNLSNHSNKQRYERYRKQIYRMLLHKNHYVINGWLLLASFFAFHQQYEICLRLSEHCKCLQKQSSVSFDIFPDSEEFKTVMQCADDTLLPLEFFAIYVLNVCKFKSDNNIV